MKLIWIEEDSEGGDRYWDLFDEEENLIASLTVIGESLYVLRLFIFNGTRFEGNKSPMWTLWAKTEKEAKDHAVIIIRNTLANIKYEAEDIVEKCDNYLHNEMRYLREKCEREEQKYKGEKT